jgi:hypothetical protein
VHDRRSYRVTKSPPFRIALAAVAALVLALVPTAVAGKPGGGGHGGSGSCTRNTPGVAIDNNYAWAQSGSYGMPGQQLTYALHVINYDVGCSSSSFVVSVNAPGGFSVSVPTNTISLKAGVSGYLWAYVTSPSTIADGDYPLTATVVRSGTASPAGTATSYYKVYSTDSTAPTLYWPNPGEGQTLSGRSYNVAVSSSDDHAVKKIELYLDGAYTSTAQCDDISYACQLNYSWSTVPGQHTATFRSYDWMGNVGVLTVNFSVS